MIQKAHLPTQSPTLFEEAKETVHDDSDNIHRPASLSRSTSNGTGWYGALLVSGLAFAISIANKIYLNSSSSSSSRLNRITGYLSSFKREAVAGQSQRKTTDLEPLPNSFGPAIIYNIHAAPDTAETTIAKATQSLLVSDEIRIAFHTDGVVAIRGLIPMDVMDRLNIASSHLIEDRTSKKKKVLEQTVKGSNSFIKPKQQKGTAGTQFYTTKVGAIFLDPPVTTNCTFEHDHGEEENGDSKNVIANTTSRPCAKDSNTAQPIPGARRYDVGSGDLSAFREVAMHSRLPQFVAELMGMSRDQADNVSMSLLLGQNVSQAREHSNNIRILRDVFLAKDDDEYICGWHVDDWGFWPATPSSIGINAWIAIDDLPVNDGGGFALAVGSHVAPWRHDAYRATGATPTYPQEGFNSAADMFAKRSGGGTCNLKKVAPKINQLMEDRKRVYDVKRGDVIFHTRWLFHRTVPFHRDVVENAFRTSGRTHLPLLHRRFSIRYVPGTSRLPSGYGMEPSVLWNETNAGQLINDVVANSGPWYPQCWPSPLCTELSELNDLVKNKLPICDERQRERKREMMPYLQAIGRKNREQQAKA